MVTSLLCMGKHRQIRCHFVSKVWCSLKSASVPAQLWWAVSSSVHVFTYSIVSLVKQYSSTMGHVRIVSCHRSIVRRDTLCIPCSEQGELDPWPTDLQRLHKPIKLDGFRFSTAHLPVSTLPARTLSSLSHPLPEEVNWMSPPLNLQGESEPPESKQSAFLRSITCRRIRSISQQ